MTQVAYVSWMNRAEMAIGKHAPLKTLNLVGAYGRCFHFRKIKVPCQYELVGPLRFILSYDEEL